MLCFIEVILIALIAWRTRYDKKKHEGECKVRFIDIRDTSGRQSGFTLMDGKVYVRGVLENGAEFTETEFRLLGKQIEKMLDTPMKHGKLNCKISSERSR